MKELSIELNITKTCNFRCTYCYEQENTCTVFKDDKPEFEFDELIPFLDKIRLSDYVKDKFDGRIRITFWGGEPLLRSSLIHDIVTYYLNEDNVTFFLYTNGFLIKELESLIETCIDIPNKLNYQISFDGFKIHEKNRKTLQGSETSKIVYDNIVYLMKKYNKLVNLKPTLPMGKDFAFISEAFKDYLRIYYYAKDELKIKNLKNFKYKPTPTWAHKISSPEAKLENPEFYEEHLTSLAEIDKLFYAIEGRHFFNWFNPSLSVCGAGKSLISIDRDYKIYTCHNFLYYNAEDIYGHVLYTPENDINELFKNLSMFNHCSLCSQSKPSEKCKQCDVIHCMRCNTAIFGSSKKSDFLDKWTDYGAQNDICELFKINHKVYKRFFGE